MVVVVSLDVLSGASVSFPFRWPQPFRVKMGTGGFKAGTDYEAARTRKVNAEAEIAELELAKIRKELCATEDVVKAWADVLQACRAKFLALPVKLAPLMSQETDTAIIKDLIEQQIGEALSELSNYDPKIDATKTSVMVETPDGEEPATAEPKRSRGRPRKVDVLQG